MNNSTRGPPDSDGRHSRLRIPDSRCRDSIAAWRVSSNSRCPPGLDDRGSRSVPFRNRLRSSIGSWQSHSSIRTPRGWADHRSRALQPCSRIRSSIGAWLASSSSRGTPDSGRRRSTCLPSSNRCRDSTRECSESSSSRGTPNPGRRRSTSCPACNRSCCCSIRKRQSCSNAVDSEARSTPDRSIRSRARADRSSIHQRCPPDSTSEDPSQGYQGRQAKLPGSSPAHRAGRSTHRSRSRPPESMPHSSHKHGCSDPRSTGGCLGRGGHSGNCGPPPGSKTARRPRSTRCRPDTTRQAGDRSSGGTAACRSTHSTPSP